MDKPIPLDQLYMLTDACESQIIPITHEAWNGIAFVIPVDQNKRQVFLYLVNAYFHPICSGSLVRVTTVLHAGHHTNALINTAASKLMNLVLLQEKGLVRKNTYQK